MRVLQAADAGVKIYQSEAARRTAFDKLLMILSTTEGIAPPAPGSVAYVALKTEMENILFAHPVYSQLTQAEIQTAFRMNADGELGERLLPYNVISRRFVTGVLNAYLRVKSDVVYKFHTDRVNLPAPPEASAEQKAAALEELLWLQWEDFKAGKLLTGALYPPMYDVVIKRLKNPTPYSLKAGCKARIELLESVAATDSDDRYIARLRQNFFVEGRIHDSEYPAVVACAKAAWLLELFTDLNDAALDLKQVIG